MCGIAGFYGFKNDSLIKKISQQLFHRGPDGEGYYIDEKVTLLNRRLAIIDRAGGDQPIYNEDKSIVVVYNGEIYNYRELRQELEANGHIFYTHSDTEVIAHGYEEWGDDCFDKFNGMFAIALYDKKDEQLILARDHFGIKPLYYALLNNLKSSVIFSSEIKPIIDSGLIEKKPNNRVIYRYLKYRVHDDQKETFFDGVYKLMPGEMMKIKSEKLKIKSYTNLRHELLQGKNKNKLSKKNIDDFRNLLTDSVKRRLVSEVPVGTCLSGGLDSSTVVAIINKLLKEHSHETDSVGESQKTFSAVFPGSTNNEEKYIDDVRTQMSNLPAGKAGVKSFKISPQADDFFKDLKDFVITQEEPTISTGPYAQYKVMQKAQEEVTVLLDGQGADEMLAGYLPYYFVYLNQLKQEHKYWLLSKEIIFSLDIIVKYSLIKLKHSFGSKNQLSINSLLNSNFVNKYQNEKYIVEKQNLKKRLIEDIFHNSLPSLLRYEDKNTMRFSIEGRVPYLDFRILNFIFSLNDEPIIKNGWNKYILRSAMIDLLPDSITKRRNKIGFTTPEYEWFRNNLDRIYEIILSPSFGKRHYFNQEEAIKFLHSFTKGETDDTLLIWRLINLELWLREFIDNRNVNQSNKPNGFSELSREQEEKTKKEIVINGKKYRRQLIKTKLFKKKDDYVKKISNSVLRSIGKSQNFGFKNKWFVVISEKIIAVAQGRSYFIWEIKPGIWANLLSKCVSKTPIGIGLGSPWTMQLAIQEVGLGKILLAAFASFLTKPLGIKGVFYQIAGREAAVIDGPTEYSAYPANVSAKLGPKDPEKIVKEIYRGINTEFQVQDSELKGIVNNYQGSVIIDANDIGQNVLANSTTISDSDIIKIFKDNPMGQGNEQTPITIVVES